ncbi:MAG: phosphoglycerate dehydrogenase [Treponema sp.]|nr:phosphoglycerate dehydrogenase [Treponema sp.]MCL2238036.1 phosphoglycerate dehydrogenase [Treponema sp.]
MFRIKTLNKISPIGLEVFPKGKYEIGDDISNPDAILVRSADMNSMEIPSSVIAIARAGAGYNNIPVSRCSESGVVVFNTPGANANAVKELTLAAMLLSSRNIVGGINWTSSVADKADVAELVEKEKSKFTGPEIKGKTLGVIGLGAIGVMVANDAMALGMNVIGFDPYISVDAAWHLSSSVARADSLESLLSKSDYVTLHIPQSEATKGLLDADKFKIIKKDARIINLSRNALVKDKDVVDALDSGKISCYVTDFPSVELLACKKVIGIPHLGASTPEAEDNCAVMAAQQIMDYLESGEVRNSVNFPKCRLEQRYANRLLVVNKNIPNMVGQITTNLANANINIQDMINHHRDDYGFSIIDSDQKIPDSALEQIRKVAGIIRVRTIER